MADYTWKNIEEVEIGEFVLSLDGKPNQVYDIEYPLLGNRALLAFEDNSLITSADHALWGRKDGEEWFVTRDTVELAYEALVGKGADLEKPIFNNDALEPFEYAHIDGFKLRKSIQIDGSPDLQLYQLRTDRSLTYIVNGYVVGSAPNDRKFDYSQIKWNDISKNIREKMEMI
jgi:hypothetical protein